MKKLFLTLFAFVALFAALTNVHAVVGYTFNTSSPTQPLNDRPYWAADTATGKALGSGDTLWFVKSGRRDLLNSSAFNGRMDPKNVTSFKDSLIVTFCGLRKDGDDDSTYALLQYRVGGTTWANGTYLDAGYHQGALLGATVTCNRSAWRLLQGFDWRVRIMVNTATDSAWIPHVDVRDK